MTNAVRLVNGPGDALPGLILEQYNRHFSAQIFHPQWLKNKQLLADFLDKEFSPRYFILKDRTQSGGAAAQDLKPQVIIDQDKTSKTIVEEYGLKFGVDLNDGLNTGLFLDMRANRHKFGQLCRGRRVLNCFAYTCSFGVHAAAQGAHVVNVDISKKTLERGRRNYDLNGLNCAEEYFVRAEVVSYLQRAVKKDNRFDLIILDPPSFARCDKGAFQVKKDLPGLIKEAAQIVNPGGVVFVSTNSNAVGYTELETMVRAAFPGRRFKKMAKVSQDVDFPGSNMFKESYLAGLVLYV